MPIFIELSVIVVLATIIALIMKLLRQPLIVGYIATGVIVGPYALNLLHSENELELFSKIGISILLFIVGLMLNPEVIKEVGKTSFLTGLGQVLFTSLLGFFIAFAFGFNIVSALYISVALTFSSTIIILKLLTDKGDTNKLYGKISIGFLLVQDLVATIILVIISVFGRISDSGVSGTSVAAIVLFKLLIVGTIIVTVLYLISKYVLPRLSWLIGSNQEVLFVFSIAWGLGIASLFHVIGFSIEIGALIAGAMLAVSPFAYEIGSRMKPLRDFFILIFFILLGSQLVLDNFSVILVPAVFLSLFVLIGNPLIVFFILNVLGYRNKTAFLSGLTVAQISEFSLILVALGYSFGQISIEVVSLVTLVGIITIAGSTYLIVFSDKIYILLKDFLELISWRKKHAREHRLNSDDSEILIFGYDRVGQDFVSAAQTMNKKFTVIDYNPQSIKRLRDKNIPHRYGDAEDVEFLQEINFHSAQLIISTIPDHKVNLLLVDYYRRENSKGIIILISNQARDAKELYAHGASYVVMPHYLGAHHAALMIARHGFDAAGFTAERNIHLVKLEKHEKV